MYDCTDVVSLEIILSECHMYTAVLYSVLFVRVYLTVCTVLVLYLTRTL